MTESVIEDMLSLVKVNTNTKIDAKKFYSEYRNECKRQNIEPILETYYFYKAAMSYKKNLKLIIEYDNRPYWVYKS